MKNVSKFAVVIGIGLALTPWATAQVPAEQPTAETVSVPVISPDQQPTKEQLAKLFEVMRIRQQMESIMKMMPAMIQQQVQDQTKEMAAKQYGGNLTPEQQEALGKVMDRYMEKARDIYTADELIDDISSIYQRHLSSTDVDAFIAFYGSPAGQHLLDAQPAIMKEYMPLVMKRTEERTKELTDQLAADIKNLPEFSVPSGDQPAAK
jgi:hypothetical protein